MERLNGTCFSNGWLYGFKRWNHFKNYRSQAEAGDANNKAGGRELPVLRTLIQHYGEKNIFNADEFGLNYHHAPIR